MKTQLEKNSKYIAVCSYRLRRRRARLMGEIAVFFLALSLVCLAALALIAYA